MSGIDGFTKLMLHCNGTDGSTSFPDSSEESHSVSAVGTAEVDTAQKVFGTGSLLCTNNGDYLSAPDSADWDFGSGDFTLDCRLRFSSLTLPPAFFVRQTSGSSYFYIAWQTNGNVRFRDYGGTFDATFPWSPSVDTWYHFAITRSGSSIRCFIDGTQIGSTQTFAGSFIDRSVPLYMGGFPIFNFWLKGWMDEIRVSKGIARWTSNFTPPTQEYSEDKIDIEETVNLDDDWSLLSNPSYKSIDEITNLDDDWKMQLNPSNASIDEVLELSDSWLVQQIETINKATKIIHNNPLVLVTNTSPAKLYTIDISNPALPVWVGYTLTGASYAKDIVHNSTTGYYYVACADGIVVKVEVADPNNQTLIDLNDTDDLETIDTFDTESLTFSSTNSSLGELHMIDEREVSVLSTNFQFLQENISQLNTDFWFIEASLLNTDFKFLQTNDTQLKTDFKWSPAPATITPIGRNDFIVKVDGTDLTDYDVIMDSISITHTIGAESVAQFSLARNHDALNQTLEGTPSTITSQNTVEVYINGNLEFSGNISNLDCVYTLSNENVIVTAKGTQQVASRKNVTMSLPSKNESLGLYNILIQNPTINNPIIDPDDDNPEFYKGIRVDLGKKIEQTVSRNRYFGDTGTLAENVVNGDFIPTQNRNYFWFAGAKNVITGQLFATLRYLGTSIASLTSDLWEILNLSYINQRVFEDEETELGEYTIGSAPYQDISTNNGILIPAERYEDKPDGLYLSKDAGYNYEDYAKQIADLEYEKMLTINGAIAPITSATLTMGIDAYYFYALKLLTRINIDNTTESNIFNGQNGFPVSIKTITISSNSMTVSLLTDNTQSIVELEEIDDRYPDEDSDEFNFPATSVRYYTKFDPNKFSTIE